MAPPPSTVVSPIVSLIVRLLTFICLIISLIVIATNSYTDNSSDYSAGKIKSTDFYAYRYLLAATVVGLAYTLLQTALNVLLVSTGNRIGGETMLQFDFYGDKVISFIVATGAAASFGLTLDFKRLTNDSSFDKFTSKAEAASSLCLLGSLFAITSSIFSSFSLPKGV